MFHKPPSLILLSLALFAALDLVFSQNPTGKCILDLQLLSPKKDSNCGRGTWGGFLSNNCCGLAFEGYLHALGKHANQTGQIFLDSTEQIHCLDAMKKTQENVIGCGIEKLSKRDGGCSVYTVSDVVNKLGNKLKNLSEDCGNLGSESSDDQSDEDCSVCGKTWQEMLVVEDEICRFSVLVAMMSTRVSDEKWIQKLNKCIGNQSLPLVSSENDHAGGTKKMSKTGILIIVGGILGIIIMVAVASWILFRKSIKPQFLKEETAADYSVSDESSCHKILIKEVYSATDNLSQTNFIGQGIAGKVYKGILSNGQSVAIKHILNDEHMETFVREVTSLSHVRHPNLVSLLGHCEEEDECFLVYELCHHGNLSEWLFGKDKYLSWSQRLEIAVDCARGLWFLHTYPEGCIVHRDIKPTNILIAASFQAKLSDFGLSKVMNMGQSYVSSEVRGTFGYVDPEYQKNHRVSSSGDVYSFGIVLLQLLSGQRVINMDMNKPMPISKMAKFLTRGGKITEFADPKLDGDYLAEAFELVFKLALSCVGLKNQRPSMEEVVVRLEKALYISEIVKPFVLHSTEMDST